MGDGRNNKGNFNPALSLSRIHRIIHDFFGLRYKV
jgi:hypothetical protein